MRKVGSEITGLEEGQQVFATLAQQLFSDAKHAHSLPSSRHLNFLFIAMELHFSGVVLRKERGSCISSIPAITFEKLFFLKRTFHSTTPLKCNHFAIKRKLRCRNEML